MSSCLRIAGPVSDQVVCPSGEARFAAYAGGPGAEFRWEMEGAAGEWTALADGPSPEGYVFAGAATGALSVRPATAFDAGHGRRFRCGRPRAGRSGPLRRALLPALAGQPARGRPVTVVVGVEVATGKLRRVELRGDMVSETLRACVAGRASKAFQFAGLRERGSEYSFAVAL